MTALIDTDVARPLGGSYRRYLDAGWRGVLPLPARAKHEPPKGFTGETGDFPTAEQVAQWAASRPEGNIALRLPAGVVGIDVDAYKDTGRASYEHLVATLGPLPATWISTSRTDGVSGIRLYRVPLGVKLRGIVAHGIEAIQRHHRYLVVEPSIHPDTGDTYRWISPAGELDAGTPTPDELPELPDAWLEDLRERPRIEGPARANAGDWSRSVKEALADAVAGMHAGSRHDTACAAAASLARYELLEHPGAADALASLGTAFRNAIADRATPSAAEKEWADIVDSARIKVAGVASSAPKWEDRTARHDDTEERDDQATASTAGAFFAKGKLVVEVLGEAIRSKAPVRFGHNDRLYRYHAGAYRNDGDDFVRQQTRLLLGRSWSKGHADQVLAWFRADFPSITERPDPRWLNVANGILDLQTLQLRDHTPELPSAIQIPVAWRPDATCPAIDKFLAEVLPDGSTELLYELAGYTLYPGNPFRKAIMLLGPTGTGKSKLLATITHLVGEDNTAAVSLQALGENRFAAADLFGRLANVCGDLDARAIKRTDTFKQITGGDPIQAERKYGHSFTFTAFATPWFSANEVPLSSDQSDAWFDRWVILPLTRQFVGAERDAFLEQKLTAPTELEGLLVRAVHALRDLMVRGRFDLPPAIASAGERYRDRLDTVRGFVDEHCVIKPGTWILRADLYRQYKNWCLESGRHALSAVNFNEHLLTNYSDRGITLTIARGQRRWNGIARLDPLVDGAGNDSEGDES